MKKLFLKIYAITSILTLLAFLFFNRVNAQSDLAIQGIKVPGIKVEIGSPIIPIITVINNGPLQNDGFNCQYDFLNSNNQPISPGTIQGRPLQPGVQEDFTSQQTWNPVGLGSFGFRVNVQTQQDPIQKNNQAQVTFMVVPMSIKRVSLNVIKQVIELNTRKDSINLYVLPNPISKDSLLYSGDSISTLDEEFQTIIIKEHSYLFFLDEYPNQLFNHPCKIIIASALDGKIQVVANAESYPLINNVLPHFGPDCTFNDNKVYGKQNNCIPKVNPYKEVPTSNSSDWAIAFSGGTDKEVEKMVIDNDICKWKERLNGSPTGPQINGANIAVHRGENNCGLTSKELCDIIDSYKGKACKKFFIKYVGHGKGAPGEKNDGIWLWDENRKKLVLMTFEKLVCKLKDNGITEVCIEITACYSGGIISQLVKKGIKGVVITSSDDKHPTPYDGDGTGTPWEKALEKCSKDPLANLNRDTHTDLCELYAWVIVQSKNDPKIIGPNPQIKKLNDTLRITNVTSNKTATSKVSTSGGDIDVYVERICVKMKLKVGNKEVDSVHYSQALYLENTSNGVRNSDKTYKVIALCKNGKKIDTLVLVEDYKPSVDSKSKICLASIPINCFSYEFVEKNKKKKSTFFDKDEKLFLSSNEISHTNEIINGFAIHSSNEFILYRFPIINESQFLNNYKSRVTSSNSKWNATSSPSSFSLDKNIETDLFVSANISDSTQFGGLIETELTDSQSNDTILFVLNTLITDSIYGNINSSLTKKYNWINASGSLLVSGLNQFNVSNSFLDVRDSFKLIIDGTSISNFSNSIFNSDGNDSLKIDLKNGTFNFNNCLFRNVKDGLILNSNSYNIDGLVVTGNSNNIITINKNGNSIIKFLTSIGATNNSIFIKTGLKDTLKLYGTSCELSSDKDISVSGNSYVTCTDCNVNDKKIQVENGSVFRRFSTLEVVVNDTNSIALSNIAVRVVNSNGTELFRGLTDKFGFIKTKILQSEFINGNYINYGPFKVSVFVGSDKADSVYEPYSFKQLVFWMTPSISSVNEIENKFSFSLFPQPAQSGKSVKIVSNNFLNEIQVIDLIGNTILKHNNLIVKEFTIDLSNCLSSGLYFLSVKDLFGNKFLKSIVINN